MAKKPYKDQNGGRLSKDPPDYLGTIAKATWRKVVPFLESEGKVKRIDTNLVEIYCTQYELYRNSYEHIQKHGEVTDIYKSLQNSSGEIIGKDFVGWKKNPMVQTNDLASKSLIKVGAELGLSPKSRSDLMQLIQPKKKDKKSLAEKLKEGAGDF
ncbi:phage terminase small subunit P27 family [Pediococcus acidilactici]|uniref:phage terminase small subunit P27 family n=1 Tax=Pediococcus acidilactici TaxID=1254 RepID=UPI001330AACA|nr:phage terminase small subunit P27 family [Pediococcus acidilactici]KAF0525670.1 phage terminase small subunit P27 family [Pediococcus acidilactici]